MRTAGHTSTVIFQEPARMVVIFGHSPLFGYLNIVQEYLFGKLELKLINFIFNMFFFILKSHF